MVLLFKKRVCLLVVTFNYCNKKTRRALSYCIYDLDQIFEQTDFGSYYQLFLMFPILVNDLLFLPGDINK